MTRFYVDVAYEPGAEPFARGDWGIVGESLAALFEGRTIKPQIFLPADGDRLTLLPDQGRESWTLNDIVLLERAHRRDRSSGTTGRFWVVFLNGYFERDGQTNKSVLGVSVTGTSVIAMFKNVVEDSGAGSLGGVIPRFVEQSTIVHELGHALGLVNNGVTLTSDHHDRKNGAHCTNQQCVMFWSNEGRESLVQFVNRYQETGNTVLFGSECLADTRLFSP
jgi:hypothetical protein